MIIFYFSLNIIGNQSARKPFSGLNMMVSLFSLNMVSISIFGNIYSTLGLTADSDLNILSNSSVNIN